MAALKFVFISLQVHADSQPSTSKLHDVLSSSSEEANSSSTYEEFIAADVNEGLMKSNQLILKLDRDEWVEALVPHANKGRLSNANIFSTFVLLFKQEVQAWMISYFQKKPFDV